MALSPARHRRVRGWRIFDPPVEGRVEQMRRARRRGSGTVRLLRADPELGYIDFARSG